MRRNQRQGQDVSDADIRLPKWALPVIIVALAGGGGGALLYGREQVVQPASRSDIAELTNEIKGLRKDLNEYSTQTAVHKVQIETVIREIEAIRRTVAEGSNERRTRTR